MGKVAKRRGRYVLDFYDQNGKRCWVTLPDGTTKEQANKELVDRERRVKHGTYLPGRRLPAFSEVADAWLKSKEQNLRSSTLEQYQGHVKNHLKPYFETTKITKINFDAIEQFKQYATEAGVTAPTLRKIFITLGAILTYAVRMRYIDFNPAREVEKPKGNSLHKDEDMFILTPEAIRALLNATISQRDKTLLMAAVFTGMREGELLGLKWDDIDWFNGQILVRRTYNHGHFFDPKTKTSRRKIDLAPELIQELKVWKLACPVGELNLVFPTTCGTPENCENMRKRQFFPALSRAGLPRIRFHNLRHTYASLLIMQGEHPKYIQSQMGHSSITVTMDTYGHLMNTVNREAASKLGANVLGRGFSENGSNLVAKKEKGANGIPLTP